VLRDALVANDPGAALVGLLQGLALDGAPDEVVNAVLLALAGGGETAPGFNECAVEACRLRGWDWRTLNDSAAIHVDRCVQTRSDSGWTRFAFVTSAAEDDSSELAGAIREMTELLLERAGSGGDPQAVGIEPWDDVPDDWPMDRPADSAPGESFATGRAQRSERLAHAGVEHEIPNRTNPASIGFVSQKSEAPVDQGELERPDGQAVGVARFRLRREGTAKDRESTLWDHTGAQHTRDRGLAGLEPAPARRTGGPRREVDWSSETGHGAVSGRLATYSQPAHASCPQFTRGEQPRRTEASDAKSQVEPQLAPPVIDWLDHIARALADECDLRGID
jgi:hypothetical protein